MTNMADDRLTRLQSKLKSLTINIGSTPLIEVWPERTEQYRCRLFAKGEFVNPTWSHYDRVYASLFQADLPSIVEKDFKVAIEVSSGNAAASFAWFCGELGLGCRVLVPHGLPERFHSHIKNFNPNVEIVASEESESRPYLQATLHDLKKELVKARREGKQPYFPNHTDRLETIAATRQIGIECAQQLKQIYGIDEAHQFVVACGNGATIVGTAREMKERYPNLKVTAFEPEEAPHGYNVKYPDNQKTGSALHELYGTGGFGIPLPFIDKPNYGFLESVDEIVLVNKAEITEAEQRRFPLGNSVGRTSLVGLHRAMQLIESGDFPDQVFVIVFYDRGRKYGYG